MVVMSVDLGAAKTGVAVCDPGEMLASPVTVVRERDRQRLLDRLSELYYQLNAGLIVVGCPRNMDGSYGDSAKNSRQFANELAALLQTKVVLWDERLTTVIAHRNLRQANVSGRAQKNIVDCVAATIILQDFLDAGGTKRNK